MIMERNMNDPSSKLLEIQNDYEQRFNCLICFSPKLRMIYGSCQHKVCQDCLYDDGGSRYPGMEKCPYCQKCDAFPLNRPNVPEDNINQQKCLGICKCSNSGCDAELWLWEIDAHQQECPGLNSQKCCRIEARSSLSTDCNTHRIRTRQKLEVNIHELGPIIPHHLSRRRNPYRTRSHSQTVYSLRSTPTH